MDMVDNDAQDRLERQRDAVHALVKIASSEQCDRMIEAFSPPKEGSSSGAPAVKRGGGSRRGLGNQKQLRAALLQHMKEHQHRQGIAVSALFSAMKADCSITSPSIGEADLVALMRQSPRVYQPQIGDTWIWTGHLKKIRSVPPIQASAQS